MNDLFQDTIYFGMAISILAYWIGTLFKKRWNHPVMNPLLIGMILIIAFLSVFKIDYETYDYGAKYLTYFLTPATVCLAIPLYKQFEALKKNYMAVLVGIFCGCITHVITVVALAFFFHLDKSLMNSVLPKSVTTAIALGICDEINGIKAVTVIGVIIAGMLGAVIGPTLLSILRVKNPIAQGLAIGCASHAVGTAKAAELGEIQAAMSSVAIVVTGLMTVVIVPIVVNYL